MNTEQTMTREIAAAIKDIEARYNTPLCNHRHMCTFEMLSGKFDTEKRCRQWRKKHPIKFPDKWPPVEDVEDYCDFCEMMNYVALDNEGRIMYVKRNDVEQLLNYFNSRENT